jgi:hypothetical protein
MVILSAHKLIFHGIEKNHAEFNAGFIAAASTCPAVTNPLTGAENASLRQHT